VTTKSQVVGGFRHDRVVDNLGQFRATVCWSNTMTTNRSRFNDARTRFRHAKTCGWVAQELLRRLKISHCGQRCEVGVAWHYVALILHTAFDALSGNVFGTITHGLRKHHHACTSDEQKRRSSQQDHWTNPEESGRTVQTAKVPLHLPTFPMRFSVYKFYSLFLIIIF